MLWPNIDLGTNSALAATAIGASPGSINLADGYRLIVDGAPVSVLPASMNEAQVEEEAVQLALKVFKPVQASRAFFSSGSRTVFERLFHVEVMDPWEAVEKYALQTDKEICKALRIPVDKATNPKKKAGFLRIAKKLKKALGDEMMDLHEMHLMGMIEMLGTADLTALTGAEATAFYTTVASGSIPGSAIQTRLPRWQSMFKGFGEDIFGKTKVSEINNFKFGVEPSLSLLDIAAVERMSGDQVNFVRNQFGVRSQAMTMKAREIVRQGMANGMDGVAIGKEIEKALPNLYAKAGRNYAEVAAQAFVGRARSWSSINTYREAGVKKSRIVAVQDEVTTEFCAAHDGVLIDVELAWQKYEQESQLSDPEEIKYSSPWVHGRYEQDGSRTLGFYDDMDKWTPMYKAGNYGDKFKPLYSPEQFQVVGIGPPPYHGRCRTDIQPEIETLTDTRRVTSQVVKPTPPPPEPPKGSYAFPLQPNDWLNQAKGTPLNRDLYGGNPMNVVQGLQAYMGTLHPGLAQVNKVDISGIGLKSRAQNYVAETYLTKDGTLRVGSGDKLWKYMLDEDKAPLTIGALYNGVKPLTWRDWSNIDKGDRKAMTMFSDVFSARAARSMASNHGASIKERTYNKFLGKKGLFGLHESLKGGWYGELKKADPEAWTSIGKSAIQEWMQMGFGKKVIPDVELRKSWFQACYDKVQGGKKDWFDLVSLTKPTNLRGQGFMDHFAKLAGLDIKGFSQNGALTPMKDLLSDVGTLHLASQRFQGGETWKTSMEAYLKKRAEVGGAIDKLADEKGRIVAMAKLRKAIEQRTAKVGSGVAQSKVHAKAGFGPGHEPISGSKLAQAKANVDGWHREIMKMIPKDITGNKPFDVLWYQMNKRGYYSGGGIHFDISTLYVGSYGRGEQRRTAWHEFGHALSERGNVGDFNLIPFRLMMRDKVGDSGKLSKISDSKTHYNRMTKKKEYEWYHAPLPGKKLFKPYCSREYSVTNGHTQNGILHAFAKDQFKDKPGMFGFDEATSMALQQFRDEASMLELYKRDPDYFATAYTWLMGGYQMAEK